MDKNNPHAIAGAGVEGVLPDPSTYNAISPENTTSHQIEKLALNLQERLRGLSALVTIINDMVGEQTTLRPMCRADLELLDALSQMAVREVAVPLCDAEQVEILSRKVRREDGNA